jgi:hypothetical protein
MHHGPAVSGIVLVGALALCGISTSALGQSSDRISLIQQDSSDCTNTTVKDDPYRTRGGDILVTRNADGTTSVKVGMTVTPDTTYHFYLKCVRQLGDITTDDGGIGEASFSFQTSSVGDVYAFYMYPDGAPSGDKFQSLTVTFK